MTVPPGVVIRLRWASSSSRVRLRQGRLRRIRLREQRPREVRQPLAEAHTTVPPVEVNMEEEGTMLPPHRGVVHLNHPGVATPPEATNPKGGESG